MFELKFEDQNLSGRAGDEQIVRVTQTWQCLFSEREQRAAELRAKTYTDPAAPRPLPCVSLKNELYPKDLKGYSLLIAVYERQLTYDPATFPLGRATVARRSADNQRPVRGADGTFLQREPDKDGIHHSIVDGLGQVPTGDSLVYVRTAYDPSSYDPWALMHNRGALYNEEELDNLGIPEGQALLRAFSHPEGYRWEPNGEPIPVEYIFWVRRDGWLGHSTVQRLISVPIDTPIYHEDTLEGEALWWSQKGPDFVILETSRPTYIPTEPSDEARQLVIKTRSGGPHRWRSEYTTTDVQPGDFSDLDELAGN